MKNIYAGATLGTDREGNLLMKTQIDLGSLGSTNVTIVADWDKVEEFLENKGFKLIEKEPEPTDAEVVASLEPGTRFVQNGHKYVTLKDGTAMNAYGQTFSPEAFGVLHNVKTLD